MFSVPKGRVPRKLINMPVKKILTYNTLMLSVG
jgi:hypothetical protein